MYNSSYKSSPGNSNYASSADEGSFSSLDNSSIESSATAEAKSMHFTATTNSTQSSSKTFQSAQSSSKSRTQSDVINPIIQHMLRKEYEKSAEVSAAIQRFQISAEDPTPRSIAEDNNYLYIVKTTQEIDYYGKSTWIIIFTTIFFPIVFVAPVIMVPLGGLKSHEDDDGSVPIDPWSYVVFQLMYNLIAYNCMVRPISIPLSAVLTDNFYWYYIPISACICIFLIYYFLVVAYQSRTGAAVGTLPVYGISFFIVYMWILHLIGCILKDNEIQAKKNKINSLANKEERDEEEQRNARQESEVGPMSDVTLASPNDRNTSNRAHSIIANVTTLPYRFSQYLNQTVSPTKGSLTRPSEHNRKYYKKPNPQDQVMITYKEMWCRVVLMSGLILAMYNWCVWFTALYPDVEDTKYAFFYVIIFFVVTGLSSLLVRIAANLVDRALSAQHCMISLNIITGLMADTFLIVFQRNLFSIVSSWQNFFIFNIIACSYELIVYQFSVTETYERMHDRILDFARGDVSKGHRFQTSVDIIEPTETPLHGKTLEESTVEHTMSDLLSLCWTRCLRNCAVWYAKGHGWRSGNIFIHKNCLNLSYRYSLRVVASISYMIYSTFLHFSYNSPYYKNDTGISIEKYERLMGFIAISLLLETVAIAGSAFQIYRRTKISLFRRFISFFDISTPFNRGYLAFYVWVVAHVITDVFVAKINYEVSEL